MIYQVVLIQYMYSTPTGADALRWVQRLRCRAFSFVNVQPQTRVINASFYRVHTIFVHVLENPSSKAVCSRGVTNNFSLLILNMQSGLELKWHPGFLCENGVNLNDFFLKFTHCFQLLLERR